MPSAEARPMKYPYTYTAKIAQFPMKHFYRTQWLFRYSVYSLGFVLPLFWWITKKVNSPEYVAQHEENMRIMKIKDHAEHARKFPKSH